MKKSRKRTDDDKHRWSLFPWEAAEKILEVITYDAEKNGDNNWRNLEGGEQRFLDATVRDIIGYKRGIKFDYETGLHTLAHAACNALFLLELKLDNKDELDGVRDMSNLKIVLENWLEWIVNDSIDRGACAIDELKLMRALLNTNVINKPDNPEAIREKIAKLEII